MANDIEKKVKRYLKNQQDRTLDFSLHSHARLGLGHTGGHLKLKAWLDLQMDFAQAKDAVFSSYNASEIKKLCDDLNLQTIEVQSQANDAREFVLRPDLGRLLAHESENELSLQVAHHHEYVQRDVLIVISGGLSPIAIQWQIPEFLPKFIHRINEQQRWTIAPVIITPRGRVALGDHINHYFKAKVLVMLIGERPGLSTPDSMGIYFTYQAKPGCTDEQRNCISNIHERGLAHEHAALKLIALIGKSMASKISGIALKDDVLEELK